REFYAQRQLTGERDFARIQSNITACGLTTRYQQIRKQSPALGFELRRRIRRDRGEQICLSARAGADDCWISGPSSGSAAGAGNDYFVLDEAQSLYGAGPAA